MHSEYPKANFFVLINFLTGISTGSVLTSMSQVSDGGSNWLGDLASALLPPKNNAGDGDCMGLSSLGLLGIPCDTVSNFVCQAPEPKLLGENGEQMPFSLDLLMAADSLGVEYFFRVISHSNNDFEIFFNCVDQR